jgi:16S rRNA processing protein RimM
VGDRVEVGVVARPHGVRGELRIALHAPGPTSLMSVKTVLLGEQSYEVVSARLSNDAVLLRVSGIADRDAAAALRGVAVSVPRSEIQLDDGEILLSDLLGCQVFLEDGTAWGEVVEIAPGAQDRLIIVDGDIERMLPMVDEFLIEVDVEGRRIVVDPPEGLPESTRE